jgi:hypothetical protein
MQQNLILILKMQKINLKHWQRLANKTKKSTKKQSNTQKVDKNNKPLYNVLY